jgi:hypothetical protein
MRIAASTVNGPTTGPLSFSAAIRGFVQSSALHRRNARAASPVSLPRAADPHHRSGRSAARSGPSPDVSAMLRLPARFVRAPLRVHWRRHSRSHRIFSRSTAECTAAARIPVPLPRRTTTARRGGRPSNSREAAPSHQTGWDSGRRRGRTKWRRSRQTRRTIVFLAARRTGAQRNVMTRGMKRRGGAMSSYPQRLYWLIKGRAPRHLRGDSLPASSRRADDPIVPDSIEVIRRTLSRGTRR